MRFLTSVVAAVLATTAHADQPDIRAIVDSHVLPGYEALASETAELAAAASADCTPENPDLIAAYHEAFDAWVSVSHMRFGPSEDDDRAFALAFWPDPRSSTPKTLATMIRDRDDAVADPAAFRTVSVAARGFYALEFLLFDPQLAPGEAADYHCALVTALTADIAATSEAIRAGWAEGYDDLMAEAGNDTYRTSEEAARQFFTALSTGLEFTSQTRLARPLGTFDRPRPNRAEARRSERSLRHVALSLQATRDLATMISDGNAELEDAFDAAIQRAEGLDDPVFAGVTQPQGRLRVEALMVSVEAIRIILRDDVGPSLGVSAGFNALDGD